MATKEKFQEGDPITWLQVHNLLPILVAIVSVVTVFYTLLGKVDVLRERMEFQQTAIQSNQVTISALQNALHESQLDIKALQTEKQDVKGVSIKATPTPTRAK